MGHTFMAAESSSGKTTKQSARALKAVGRWARARVIFQNGAIVTVETDKAVLRVNQSKVRQDRDPWHDAPLPRNLDKPEKDVSLETDDADDHPEEDVCTPEGQKDKAAMCVTFRSS